MISKVRLLVSSTLFCSAWMRCGLPAEPNTNLYVITATPVDMNGWQSPAALHVVNERDLNLTSPHQIVRREQGVSFVIANQELRTVVIGSPPIVPTHFDIVNMDSPGVVRQVDIIKKDLTPVFWHLLVPPSGAVFFGLHLASKQADRQEFIGVKLADLEDRNLPWEWYQYASLDGFGGWSPPNLDSMWVFPFEDGRLTLHYGMSVTKTPWSIPKQAQFPSDYNLSALVNNRELLVVAGGRQQESYKVTDLRVLDKSNTKWHLESFPGSASQFRGFGRWLALIVQEENSHRESPGKKERPQVDPRLGYNFDVYMEAFELYRPGTLILYNGATTRRYTIETHQGDSEVLLVDGETLYYRVNRAIWKAHIGADKIGSPTLVADDPLIRDAHWAFLGPKVP